MQIQLLCHRTPSSLDIIFQLTIDFAIFKRFFDDINANAIIIDFIPISSFYQIDK